MTEQNRARNLIFVSAVLWSLSGVGIKSIQAPAAAVAAYRSLFAALALSPFIIGKLQTVSWNPFIILAALAYAGTMITFVSATQRTYAANAIVLQHTAPIFVFLLNRTIFKSLRKVPQAAPENNKEPAVLAGCMAGILIIFFGQAGGAHSQGILLALLSSVCFALYIVCAENIRNIQPAAVVFIVNIFASIVIFIIGRPSLLLPQKELILLFFLGTFQLGLPYLLFNTGLRQVRSEEASLIILIEPLLNPLWVALLFREIPPAATFIGGGCILASLALRYWPR